MDNIIDIKNLKKTFGDIKAVDDLSFRVKKGEFFAFLGVNGAGKSTTISIMCGQLKKDSGTVKICDYDVEKDLDRITSRIGVVYQNSVLDQQLTVKDNLKCRSALYGITGSDFNKRIDELSALLDFKDLLNRTVGNLSGGQRRRIDIARALLHSPEILILDEPTTGLDPQTRQLLWNVITTIRKEKNMTVFLTTHYMEETADADYIVILDNGQIVAEGTPLYLKNTYTGDYITLYDKTEAEVKELNLSYEIINNSIRIPVDNTEKATELILKYPKLFTDYEIIKGKMDDVFLSATGKKLVGGEGK